MTGYQISSNSVFTVLSDTGGKRHDIQPQDLFHVGSVDHLA